MGIARSSIVSIERVDQPDQIATAALRLNELTVVPGSKSPKVPSPLKSIPFGLDPTVALNGGALE